MSKGSLMTRNNADLHGGAGNVFVNANHGDILHLTPHEILKHAVVGDMYDYEGDHVPTRDEQSHDMDEYFNRKLDEADSGRTDYDNEEQRDWWKKSGMTGHAGGLYQSIRDNGFDESSPIEVTHDINKGYWQEPYISDGNHRLAVARFLSPNRKIPVRVLKDDSTPVKISPESSQFALTSSRVKILDYMRKFHSSKKNAHSGDLDQLTSEIAAHIRDSAAPPSKGYLWGLKTDIQALHERGLLSSHPNSQGLYLSRDK